MDLDGELAALYPDALRYALALTGSHAGAEDLVQDSLIRLLGRARRATIDNPPGYLHTIITREFLRSRRRSSSAPGAPVGSTDGGTVRVDQRLEAAELLAPLSPRERAAIVARYYLDLPLAGVAELMGISLGTAKATVFHGLQKLERRRAESGRGGGAEGVECPARTLNS